jgi:hypothetical protein
MPATQADNRGISRFCIPTLSFHKTGKLNPQESRHRQASLCGKDTGFTHRFLIQR